MWLVIRKLKNSKIGNLKKNYKNVVSKFYYSRMDRFNPAKNVYVKKLNVYLVKSLEKKNVQSQT